MQQLQLSPLPCVWNENTAHLECYANDGFVDEQEITRIMRMPYATRVLPNLSDLMLAADEDFAGWRSAAETLTFIPTDEAKSIASSTFKRAKPPFIDEPGIGQPVSAGHRWWLAGASGMITTFLFSLLLLFLSNRNFESAPLVAPKPSKHTPHAAESPAEGGPEITLHHKVGGM